MSKPHRKRFSDRSKYQVHLLADSEMGKKSRELQKQALSKKHEDPDSSDSEPDPKQKARMPPKPKTSAAELNRLMVAMKVHVFAENPLLFDKATYWDTKWDELPEIMEEADYEVEEDIWKDIVKHINATRSHIVHGARLALSRKDGIYKELNMDIKEFPNENCLGSILAKWISQDAWLYDDPEARDGMFSTAPFRAFFRAIYSNRTEDARGYLIAFCSPELPSVPMIAAAAALFEHILLNLDFPRGAFTGKADNINELVLKARYDKFILNISNYYPTEAENAQWLRKLWSWLCETQRGVVEPIAATTAEGVSPAPSPRFSKKQRLLADMPQPGIATAVPSTDPREQLQWSGDEE